MKHQHYILAAFLAFAFAPGTQAAQAIGWIEHVQLQPQNLQLQAKIDTGADNTSIHAENIEIYEKDGIKMVKFDVANQKGESAQYVLPLVRYANIKRKGAEPLKRPVVSMNLCLGNTLRSVNINLANRANFKYRMLIGRSYLKDLYLVDSGKQYTAEPDCKGQTLAQKDEL